MNELQVYNKPLTAVEMIGKRFNRWVVLSFSHVNKHRSWCYVCQCDCGTVKTVNGGDLRSGRNQSCGCLHAERMTETHSGPGNSHYVDGRSHTKLYRLWHGMIERCTDPKHISFKYYGGKGIIVCAEWLNDFSAFRDWAEANGYKDGLSIDRIHSSADYSPDNCQIMTRAENTAKGNRERGIQWGI